MEVKSVRARRKFYLTVERSTDPVLGLSVLSCAERWANAIEERLGRGERLEDVAEETHGPATGYAEGLQLHTTLCDRMVEFLDSCWVHGARLSRWYGPTT